MNAGGMARRRAWIGLFLLVLGCGRPASQNLSKDATADPDHFAKVRAEAEARNQAQLEAERKRFNASIKSGAMP